MVLIVSTLVATEGATAYPEAAGAGFTAGAAARAGTF